jgi:hypothetical protein
VDRGYSDRPDPFPDLVLDVLIGLTPDEAEALAGAKGVAMIRLIESVDGVMVGAIDMMLAPTRLNLWHQDGRVVLANFDGGRRSGRHSKST